MASLLLEWSRLTLTDQLIADGIVLPRGSFFAGTSYIRSNSQIAKKMLNIMPYKPRHSNEFELSQVFNHHIGKFLNPTMNGHRQLEAHCTCGWKIKLVKWREETDTQHKRRFQRGVERHCKQVLNNEGES